MHAFTLPDVVTQPPCVLLCTSITTYQTCLQVLTIAMQRPASLVNFFKQQQQQQQQQSQNGDRSKPTHELAELLVHALPWVLQSLQAHTGNPRFPPTFLRCLVQACVAAVVTCAEALTGTQSNGDLIGNVSDLLEICIVFVSQNTDVEKVMVMVSRFSCF